MFKIGDIAAHLLSEEESYNLSGRTKKTQHGEPVVGGAAGNEASLFLRSLIEGTTPPEIHPGVAENIRAFHKHNLEGKNTKCEDNVPGTFMKGQCDAITTGEGPTGTGFTVTELTTGDVGAAIVKAALYGLLYSSTSLEFDILIFNPLTGVEYKINSLFAVILVSDIFSKTHFVWEENGNTNHKYQMSTLKNSNLNRLKLGKGERVFYNGDRFDVCMKKCNSIKFSN